MDGKDKSILHALCSIKATTLLLSGVVVTNIFVFILILLNHNHIAMAQQRQQLIDNSFQMGNMTFSHNLASVNGIKLHYAIGGHGDPVVLVLGWPETWYDWHKVMPALAKNHTVIAPDLRGLGDSSKPPTGYNGEAD